MFHTREDHFNWDKYEEQLPHIDLSDDGRVRALNALRYLRRVLGEDFLGDVAGTGHPLLSALLSVAPRERLYLAELAEKMQALQDADRFDDVLRQLRNPVEVEAALSVLDLAHRFLSVSFSVAFEQEAHVTQRSGEKRLKYPDLKITNHQTGEEIFVEVSQLLASASQTSSRETLAALHFAVHHMVWNDPESDDFPPSKHVHPRVKFHRGLSEQELRDVIKRINELADQVRCTRSFGEFQIEGVIEVGIAPSNHREAAVKWAIERGMREAELVEAPLIDTDEVFRACRKILQEKVWQIPDEGPGIVVLPTHRNLILFTHDIGYVISGIEEAIAKEPKLYCVILTLGFDGFEPEGAVVKAFGRHTVFRIATADGHTEFVVIIRNPLCKALISEVTIEKIDRAFVGT